MNQHVIRPDRFTRNVLRKVAEGALSKDAEKMEGLDIELHKIKQFCEGRTFVRRRIVISRTLQLFLEFINRTAFLTISTPMLLLRKSLIRIKNIEFDRQPTEGYVIALHFGEPASKIQPKQEDMMLYPFRPCRSKIVIWGNNILGSQGGEVHMKDGTTVKLETFLTSEVNLEARQDR